MFCAKGLGAIRFSPAKGSIEKHRKSLPPFRRGDRGQKPPQERHQAGTLNLASHDQREGEGNNKRAQRSRIVSSPKSSRLPEAAPLDTTKKAGRGGGPIFPHAQGNLTEGRHSESEAQRPFSFFIIWTRSGIGKFLGANFRWFPISAALCKKKLKNW